MAIPVRQYCNEERNGDSRSNLKQKLVINPLSIVAWKDYGVVGLFDIAIPQLK